MENDLIRRGDVMEALYRVCEADQEEYFSVKQMKAIDSIPAVDAAEVVRCGQCESRYYAMMVIVRTVNAERRNKMRLIDADKANEEAYDALEIASESGYGSQWEAARDVQKIFNDAPTIDAVPVVHGEWEITRQAGFDILYCSACGEPLNCNDHGEYYKKKMRFCPWCGARMDGRREDGDWK